MNNKNIEIKHFEELGSTNDYAVKMIELGEITSDTAIIADKQTNGRGRLNGRVWISPMGNFYCSYMINLQDLYIAETQTNSLTFENMEILHKYVYIFLYGPLVKHILFYKNFDLVLYYLHHYINNIFPHNNNFYIYI